MSVITTDNRYYTDIANAIRSKNGTSDTYKPSEMSAAIEELKDNEVLVKIVERDGNLTSLSAEDLKGITKIGNDAFSRCSSLRNVEIPDTVTEVGDGAFAGTNLYGIDFPDSVIRIGSNVVSNINDGGSVGFGKNVNYIGYRAITFSSFYYIELRCTIPPTLYSSESIYAHKSDGFANLIIHVPVGYADIYKSATNWATFADYIVDDLVVE